MATSILWTPDAQRVRTAALTRWREGVEVAEGASFADYAALHHWSVARADRFWGTWLDAAQLVVEGAREPVRTGGPHPMDVRFFPGLRLNYAENLLRAEGDGEALVARDESGGRRTLSWNELRATVARHAAALRAEGVGPGDRVAGFLPNGLEAIVAMLATSALGAAWSSCSPDFGVAGTLDRLGQVGPCVLYACLHATYGGRTHDLRERISAIARGLPSLRRVVTTGADGPGGDVPHAVSFEEFQARGGDATLAFERLSFDHPLFVLFSSGTTGTPKAIVHGAGGTLLQHRKEHALHLDVRPGDRVFYYTTCGWMMWNWLASALASRATLVLFDGAPTFPDEGVLWRLVAEERVTLFGTSAKYLDALRKRGFAPREHVDLAALRTVTSTGSPLVPEGFDQVYETVKRDVHLASISGGTDIVSCFVLGVPTEPVRRGEIQAPGLGMDVAVLDAEGKELRGQQGELVCRNAFPSMPIGFLDDPGRARYRRAYFERYPGVWHHGDFAERTASGGFVIRGRSDAVLNPGGVRIGTAEIYRIVERLPEVEEALCIGQTWEDDCRVVLFVRLVAGAGLDAALEARIRGALREGASPRHVPARILAVADLPRTKSGKISEIAVREIVHGRAVDNREALANPEALDLFRDLDLWSP